MESYEEVEGRYYVDYQLNENQLTVLLEDCICTPDWTFDLDKLLFRQITVEETIYYKITLSEQGEPQIVNTETYIAPNQKNLILQPINK